MSKTEGSRRTGPLAGHQVPVPAIASAAGLLPRTLPPPCQHARSLTDTGGLTSSLRGRHSISKLMRNPNPKVLRPAPSTDRHGPTPAPRRACSLITAVIMTVLTHLHAALAANATSEDLQSQPSPALVAAATSGDADAQFTLGLWHFRKAPTSTNRFGPSFQAIKWLRKAAEDRNNDKAQFYLAVAHLDGVGVEQDSEKALYWFRRAAGQNLPEAQFNVALMQARANASSPSDYDPAQLLRKAADQGLAEAHFTMAVLTSEGYFSRPDDIRAWECYRNALTNQFAQTQIDAALKLEAAVRASGNRSTSAAQPSSDDVPGSTGPFSPSVPLRYLNAQGSPDDVAAATNWWSNALRASFASHRFAAVLRLPELPEKRSTFGQSAQREAVFPRPIPVQPEEPELTNLLGTTNADEVMTRFPSLSALDHFLKLKGYEPTPVSRDDSPRRRRGESLGESLLDRYPKNPFEDVPPSERRFIEDVRERMAVRDKTIAQVQQEIRRFVEGPDSFIKLLPGGEGLFETEFRLKYGTSPLEWYLDKATPSIKLEEILNVVSRMYTRGADDVVEAIQLVRLITQRYGALDTKRASLTAKELERELDSYRRQVSFFLNGQMGPKTTREVAFGEEFGGRRLITMIDEFYNSRPVRKRSNEDLAEISALYNAIAKLKGWPLLASGRIELQSTAEELNTRARSDEPGQALRK